MMTVCDVGTTLACIDGGIVEVWERGQARASSIHAELDLRTPCHHNRLPYLYRQRHRQLQKDLAFLLPPVSIPSRLLVEHDQKTYFSIQRSKKRPATPLAYAGAFSAHLSFCSCLAFLLAAALSLASAFSTVTPLASDTRSPPRQLFLSVSSFTAWKGRVKQREGRE